ncbi:hypothetical protein [Actinocatenispora rupis]|uniref:Uncharacterized protein n=1 Tax=Actinocatenispora rupis TaxID=519421 RepID=A0A8J3IWU9_9ACTN|nr:hypothetical protein [Actinocatenispora rupis]GID11456.1 hypothetical protein Aru02nite_23450 [Actinocatenispora rupis]
MNHQNHWYGHAHVFARYCGLRTPPRIRGFVQHGWNIHDGYGADDPPPPGVPRLVWSDGPRRRGIAAGAGNYRVIGAPFAYLLAMADAAATPGATGVAARANPGTADPAVRATPGVTGLAARANPGTPGPAARANAGTAAGRAARPGTEPVRRGTIFYPFHGWEAQAIFGDHRALAAEIAAREEPPVTVCLYWMEFRHPQIREMYESFGFRVITHGTRGGHYQGTDPWFLDKQLAELRAHRRVGSNRLCTALLYGAAAGCEVGVYGDPMLIENENPAYGGNARVRRLWPEMHAPAVDRRVSDAVAAEELGRRYVAPPAEIADLFGWTRDDAPAGAGRARDEALVG